jgi:hypothetical protein
MTKWLSIMFLFLASINCSGGGVDGIDGGMTNKQLFQRQAPEGLTYKQTQDVEIKLSDLPQQTQQNTVEMTFFKISMDYDGLETIYLGKPLRQSIKLTVPKRISKLFFEVYSDGQPSVKTSHDIR